MVKKSKGDLSKRVTLRKKYSILKHIRDHRRDVRRAVKKNTLPKKKSEFVSETAVLRLPNKSSQKQQLLELAIENRKKKCQSNETEVQMTQEKVLKDTNKSEQNIDDYESKSFEIGKTYLQEEKLRMMQNSTNLGYAWELAKCMNISDAVVYTADARAPCASINEDVIALWQDRGAKIVLLLTNHQLAPENVVTEWVGNFKRNGFFHDVMVYSHDKLLRVLKNLQGAEETFTVSIIGLPNTGTEIIEEDMKFMASRKKSVHSSSTVESKEFTSTTGLRILFPSKCSADPRSKLTGLDIIFRSFKSVMKLDPIELTLFAEEILKEFSTAHLTLHYKLQNAKELAPIEVLDGIKKSRGHRDIFQSVRDVLNDYHKGKLKWCCVPPSVELKSLTEWNVINQDLLCTQTMLPNLYQLEDS